VVGLVGVVGRGKTARDVVIAGVVVGVADDVGLADGVGTVVDEEVVLVVGCSVDVCSVEVDDNVDVVDVVGFVDVAAGAVCSTYTTFVVVFGWSSISTMGTPVGVFACSVV
jgi:hypothetical protein